MKAFEANGQILHGDDEGPRDGPVVVFANSLGTDFRLWDPLLTHLPQGLRLIRYDKRGHGLSTCPDGPYTIEDHRRDLEGLLDGLAIEAAVIVGLSVGGMIAQALGAARPDLVKGLVLCDTGHVIGPPSIWEDRIRAIRADGIASLADGILQRWFSPRFHQERPDELALWRAMVTRTPLEGYLGTCRAIQQADLTEGTKGLTMPAICVVGSEDGATTPALMRSTADLIAPGSRLIEGAGHLPCVEAPDVLAGIITSFLRENRFV
ncbi:MAG: 3-oxoadipate enol-lactonase [Rhizobiales bacterium]|nr:3-oxoadipate enol-lactonase [Hyphomicrobiales bacterium]